MPGDPGETAWLAGGRSFVGTAAPVIAADGEAPPRKVRLAPFGIEREAVSNARFASFVTATGYVTEAEQIGWSFVFSRFLRPAVARTQKPSTVAPWWVGVDGACWSAPEGPGSTVEDRKDHPATHVSWNDAHAFAAWVGGRLPTEAEWEHAARGGTEGRYPWGDREPDDTDFLPCNIWQGRFPDLNSAADGSAGTAPVGSFPANGFGLHNMVGNVWEWCEDAFRIRSVSRDARARNEAARRERHRIMKGGSYLCHRSYCHRYRVAARVGLPADTATGHLGFRVVYGRRGTPPHPTSSQPPK